MATKRNVTVQKETGLKSTQNLILIGIMMAVGIVLRLCASFIVIGNMRPNFLIATYCLSILMVRPKLFEAAIIGLISGLISQIGTGMPWIGLISETVGAVVMAVLVVLPMPKMLKPLITTFLTTLASGFAFTGLAALTYANPMPTAQFVQMATVTVFTAALNCAIIFLIAIPVGKVMNKD